MPKASKHQLRKSSTHHQIYSTSPPSQDSNSPSSLLSHFSEASNVQEVFGLCYWMSSSSFLLQMENKKSLSGFNPNSFPRTILFLDVAFVNGRRMIFTVVSWLFFSWADPVLHTDSGKVGKFPVHPACILMKGGLQVLLEECFSFLSHTTP